MPEAVIVAIGRSPIGRAMRGALADVRPDDLGAAVVRGVLDQVPQLPKSEIADVIAGTALPSGEQGGNLGRIISVLSGIDAPGTVVNRFCSSSLQGTRMAFHAIKAGEGDAFVSVGAESSSRCQLGVVAEQIEARNPRLSRDNPEGLPDIYISMGETAENVAERCGISRQEMDRYALQSQQRASKAQEDGVFDREIIPVRVLDGSLMLRDEGPRPETTLEALAELRTVFKKDGTVTAGNACPLNDGAAAAIIMSDTRARELEITPLARIVATGVSALEPELMGLGPIEATRQALKRAGMTIDDVDIVEMNEAFAAQVIPSARGIDVDPASEKLNPFGGAIALGHPFGMTGVRLLSQLLNGLRTYDKTTGLATLCVGGGQGMAMVIERLN